MKMKSLCDTNNTVNATKYTRYENWRNVIRSVENQISNLRHLVVSEKWCKPTIVQVYAGGIS